MKRLFSVILALTAFVMIGSVSAFAKKGDWTDRDIMLKSKSLPNRAFKLTRTQNTAAVVIPIIIVIAAAGGTFALISINRKNKQNDRGGEE